MCKVWKVFVNALTSRDKYSLRNRKNLTQPIQMQLSQKQEILSEIFFWIFELSIKFWTSLKETRPS